MSSATQNTTKTAHEIQMARFNDRVVLRRRLLEMILRNEAHRKAQPR